MILAASWLLPQPSLRGFAMRLAALFLALVMTTVIASASTYGYPTNIKPAVSLLEACNMAAAMLKAQGDVERFHSYSADLLGDEKGAGDGAWTIRFSDADGNKVWAHIPLHGKSCSLAYYAHDYSTKGGERREIKFVREGAQVSAPVKEPAKVK